MQPAKFREMLPGLGWSIGHKDTMIKGNLTIRFKRDEFEIWRRDPQTWIATIWYTTPRENLVEMLNLIEKQLKGE